MKVKDGTDYPGKTLYEITICVQKHLSEIGVYWKLIKDSEFKTLKTLLDDVM